MAGKRHGAKVDLKEQRYTKDKKDQQYYFVRRELERTPHQISIEFYYTASMGGWIIQQNKELDGLP